MSRQAIADGLAAATGVLGIMAAVRMTSYAVALIVEAFT